MERLALGVPLALLALCGLLLGAGATTDPVGKAAVVRNVATIATPATAPVRLQTNAAVFQNNVIATGPKSAVGIILADTTQFSIGANAQVRIDDFIFDTKRNASKMTISFVKGAFRFVSGKPTHGYPGQTAIVTPAGTIGIRGTIVTGVIGPDALKLYQQINPAIAQAGEASETATLIILSDPGEEGGGIDLTARGEVTSLRKAGQALYFPSQGSAPLPPIMVGPRLRGMIERQAGPPSFGRPAGMPGPQNGRDQQRAGPGSSAGPPRAGGGDIGQRGAPGNGGPPR